MRLFCKYVQRGGQVIRAGVQDAPHRARVQQELLVLVHAVLGGPAAEIGGGPAGHGDGLAAVGVGLFLNIARRQPGEGYVHLIHVVYVEQLAAVPGAELPQAASASTIASTQMREISFFILSYLLLEI